MLLDILLIIGSIEKAIGDDVRINLSSRTHNGTRFPTGLKITAEWLVERQLVRLEHIVPVIDLTEANDQTEVEKFILNDFVAKAKAGYLKKLHEMRTQIETEIRNAAKT
jgi:hypothetical protein